METFLNYIGGEHRPSQTGKFLEVVNPATGAVYAQVPDSGTPDVEQAIRAAQSALPGWSNLSNRERAEWLRRIAGAIAEDLESFARAETQDSGKPIRLSRTVDIPRSVHNFEFFADAATQFSSESHAEPMVAVNFTLRQPIGVVGCISPWNLPLYLFTWKIAPALAAGNTVVAKPSEVTPSTAYLLGRVCEKIGFPKGVLNIVHGTGPSVGSPLVAHAAVKAISFTGSTAVGRSIAESCGKQLKKVSLELGGKNALIVFDDVDLEKTLDTAARAAFSNQGQICLSASRILVHEKIYADFREGMLKRIRQWKQGDPMDAGTDQGAVASKVHFEKVLGCLDTARSEGAKILCGGGAAQLAGEFKKGFFIQPTLLEGLKMESRTNQEEIFGPVSALIPFSSEEEALKLANQTEYGLSASLWTKDADRILRFSRAIQSGILWVNCWMLRDLRTPFGGVKSSGLGREGGWDAMRFFTEPKNICIAQN